MLMMSTHSLSVISSRSLACKALDYQLSRRFFFKSSCCYPECCGGVQACPLSAHSLIHSHSFSQHRPPESRASTIASNNVSGLV